jgi:hypothetical protein
VSGQEEPNLRTGLADIDRRLRALQDELASADAPAEALGPPAPAPPREPAAVDRTAEDLALAIIARAEAQAGQIVDAAHDRVVALNTQAAELMHLRDSLRRSARELIAEYDAALRRLDAGFGEPPAPGPAAPPPAADHTAGAAAATSTQVGVVSVSVEAFADVGDLASFTGALQRLPGAEEVTVDSFDGRRAAIVLRLAEPLVLERELYRVIPFAMEITDEGPGAVSIVLDSARHAT